MLYATQGGRLRTHGGDVDGSGIVNVLDMIAVVLNWGLCPGETGTPPDSLATEIQNAGLSWPDDWNEFVSNADDENYRCWIGHYLSGECCPSCPTCPPDCPDDDPFGGH